MLQYQNLEKARAHDEHADIVLAMQTEAYDVPAEPAEAGDALAAWLCAVAAGDRRAFEAVYSATVNRVLGLAARILGDAAAAEDVASDVYLQVWRQAARFDPARGRAIAWIMTITRSRAIDAVRRAETLASKTAVEAFKAAGSDDQASMHDLLDVTRRESSLHRALCLLDPVDRQLLALAYFRGYTHKQLAEITKQPLGTVKARIRRTLIKLRELMGDGYTGAGEET